MKPGWLKARLIRRRARKLSDETLSQIGILLKDNPHLTIEEALSVIDKNKTIFFPGEHRHPPDLKTGFASVVWKTYRCRYSADPPAATDEHRVIVFDAAYRYLNRGNIDEGSTLPGMKTRRKAKTRTAKPMIAFVIPVFIILVALGGVLFFKADVRRDGKTGTFRTSQSVDIRYKGYIRDESETRALIDKSIYRSGDKLDPEGKYVLKSITPQYIVIGDPKAGKDFIVHRQNK